MHFVPGRRLLIQESAHSDWNLQAWINSLIALYDGVIFFHFHCAPRTNVQINCARTRSCTNHDTANSSRGKGLAHTISVHAHPYRFSDAPTGNTKDDGNCVRAKIRHVSDGVKIVGIGRKRWCSSGKPSTCPSYIGCSFIPWTVTYRSDR